MNETDEKQGGAQGCRKRAGAGGSLAADGASMEL